MQWEATSVDARVLMRAEALTAMQAGRFAAGAPQPIRIRRVAVPLFQAGLAPVMRRARAALLRLEAVK